MAAEDTGAEAVIGELSPDRRLDPRLVDLAPHLLIECRIARWEPRPHQFHRDALRRRARWLQRRMALGRRRAAHQTATDKEQRKNNANRQSKSHETHAAET